MPAVSSVTFYFYSALISMTVSLLLWTLYLKIKMLYGGFKINKLTFTPMHWATFALLSKLTS